LKDQKADQAQLDSLIQDMLAKYASNGKKAAIFQKGEKIDGPLAQSLFDQLSKKSFVLQEMKDFMDQVGKVKIQSEIKNVKVAAAFAEFSIRRMTKELKNCIEGDIKLRHSKIASNMESMLED
jgi:nucleosome binding factor SPN SPT16 subunit